MRSDRPSVTKPNPENCKNCEPGKYIEFYPSNTQ